MEYEDAIERIQKIVPMIRHDVETAILSHEVMEAQNAIVPPGLKGYQTDFVQTYGAIQNALVLKLAWMSRASSMSAQAVRWIGRTWRQSPSLACFSA
ncbi:MAG: hypothetical protein QHC90_18770 [Shinella sp.]|nr:hypothetical protein [Shinella sp.]